MLAPSKLASPAQLRPQQLCKQKQASSSQTAVEEMGLCPKQGKSLALAWASHQNTGNHNLPATGGETEAWSAVQGSNQSYYNKVFRLPRLSFEVPFSGTSHSFRDLDALSGNSSLANQQELKV